MHASSSLGVSTGGNYEARFNLNIDSTSGNAATDRWINAYTDAADGTDKNFANTYLAPVSAGEHTFYFLAARYNGAGTVQLYDPSLSVLYFPSSSAEVLACGVDGNTVWNTAETSFQEIRSCALNVPKSGFVYLSGTSSAGLASGGSPYEARFRLGVDSVSGTASSDRWVNVTTDSGDGTDEAVVTSLLTSVAAGDHTFYFLAARYNGTGPLQLYDPSLVALYFPAPNFTAKVCGAGGSDTWTNSTTSYSIIRSCTLYVPKNGFAFVEASASAGLNDTAAGNDWEGQFRLGVNNDSGSSLFDRWVNVYTDTGDGTDRPVAISGLTNVITGTHTFYFVGRRYAGAGTLRLYSPSLSVIVRNVTPAITAVPDQEIFANTATASLPITVTTSADPASVPLTGSSSNPALVPDGNIVVSGTGITRTVTITPTTNLTGTAAITLLLNDPTSPVSTSFQLDVRSPVSLTAPTNQSVQGATQVGPLDFSVSGATSVTATSSNTALVPDTNIVIAGSGDTRTITLTPSPGTYGTTTITITASDGIFTATASFTLTVTPLPVSLTAPTNQSVRGATQVGPLDFSVSGATSVTATSSNTALVPDTNIVIAGSGDTRTITLTPSPGTYGTTTITITASGGGSTVTESFTVTVTPFRLSLPLLRR